MILQWHITVRCNRKCKHCYQEDNHKKKEMTTKELVEVVDKFVDFLIINNLHKKEKNHINITGGEPLIREDFFDLASYLFKKKKYFNWGILTNGSFLGEKKIEKIKQFGCGFIQLSLEGMKEKNDEIRGNGSFDEVIEKIKIILRKKIRVVVSLTLSKKNQEDVFNLADFLVELIKKNNFKTNVILGARRIVPIGRGSQYKGQLQEPRELFNFYLRVEEYNRKIKETGVKNFLIKGGCENGIFNNEIKNKKNFHSNHCGVLSKKVIIVMPDGEVFPCRRLPINLGNIRKTDFNYILEKSDYRKFSLKEDYKITLECLFCRNVRNCFGGALCVNYSFSGGTKFSPDPQCWYLFDNLNDAKEYLAKKKNISKTILKIFKVFLKSF